MKILVRIKDIKIVADDFDRNAVMKHQDYNKQAQETIKVMVEQCLKLYKESKL